MSKFHENRPMDVKKSVGGNKKKKLECGPMPNAMVALPNVGNCASVQRRTVWPTPTTRVQCSNAAKTRNPLKCAGVPQTRQQISTASGPKFTILWRHVVETLLFNKFFPIVDTCLSCEDKARQSYAMVPATFRQFFGSCISSEPRAAHFRPAF